MGEVTLTGRLVCATLADTEVVERLLPEHVELTRAEAGCLSFVVTRRPEPGVWEVEERFDSEDSYRAHQLRVAQSEWGRETIAIERNYTITGIVQ